MTNEEKSSIIEKVPPGRTGGHIRRRSEEAVTRRTRNAFIGSSRYAGSNPAVSAPEPLVFKGSFVFTAQGRLFGNWRLLSWTKFCHKVLEV